MKRVCEMRFRKVHPQSVCLTGLQTKVLMRGGRERKISNNNPRRRVLRLQMEWRDELVRILSMCGDGAEVLSKVQGLFCPPEPDVPLEHRCAQLKTDIDREERNLVELRDRLRQREEEVATLRRNVDEMTELVCTLQQQLQEVKREIANPPPLPQNTIPLGPQGPPAAPPKGPEGIPAGTDDDADMLGEIEQAMKRTRVKALPTDPSVMREWLLMMRDNMRKEDLIFLRGFGNSEESRGSNGSAAQSSMNVHSVATDTATPLG